MGLGLNEVVRDAPFGQLVRFITGNRVFQYPEEKPGFNIPEAWLEAMNAPNPPAEGTVSSSSTVAGEERANSRPTLGEKTEQHNDAISTAPTHIEGGAALDKVASAPIVPKRTKGGVILVDWYTTDDAANPHNWSNRRRFILAAIICAYTFVVYMSSAIYTTSQQQIQEKFGVSAIKASLGLSIYVLGYGVGPLLFSPLSEIPHIGRSPVYIITMFLFVILSIPTALVNNYPGLMVLRFLQGFFGSPCLASGGASMGDLYSPMYLPFGMIVWVASAYCGPALGPLLSGFAVPVKGWRWSLYESIWASSPVFLLMLFFLPETSTPTILLQRARRLRKITGNSKFISQSEIDQRHSTVSAIAVDALIKPLEITIKDPAILFVQVYSAIVYSIYYSFFEAFPIVYHGIYHMNLGQIGLVFLCVLIGCLVGATMYGSLLYFMVVPQIKKFGMGPQEQILLPGLPASFGPTIGLFLFAWTAKASIHWIAPTIGIGIYAMTSFILFQCVFLYIPLSYPQYTSSLFAANDFFRSALACGSILYAQPLFGNLGIGKGVSLLGGLSVIGILGMVLLFKFGANLRAKSRFAISS
ncbi:major facilitator superfamily domain-containing protein [Dactylonectria macrodidyma]|uniref:Major facilitator superfamily domain-containing protein n=1 Tax=Dactylonectria macrodidyma TaxID=307937 RepID=A0A9P9DLC2_9HYPO|nr:major facilitator superfamily domain-containing protein [Dactylonectria macrodidyma]